MFSSYGSQLLKKGFQQSVISQNERRKEHSQMLYELYNDEQLSILENQIQVLYSGKKTAQDLPRITLNFTRKIVNRLASVYCSDAVRTLTDAADKDIDLFSSFEKESGLAVKLKQLNRISTMTGNALLKVLWRNGKAELDIFLPSEFDVICGDSAEDVKGVLITSYDNDNKKQFTLWEEDKISLLNYNYQTISTEENPYKCLPFVHIFKQSPISTYWQEGLNSLASMQKAANMQISELFLVTRNQGFGVGTISGGGKLAPHETLALGANSVLSLPEGGKLSYESTKAPLEAVLKVIDFTAKQAAVLHGLPADSMSTESTAESGISKIVSSAELMEQRADSIALFGRFERQIFDLWRIVHNQHSQDHISDKASLVVNFADLQPVTSTLDKVKEWEAMLELGLCDLADVLMQKDPDLSREQALVKLLEIKDFNQEFQKVNTI